MVRSKQRPDLSPSIRRVFRTVGATAMVALLGCVGDDRRLGGLTPLYDFTDHLDEARVIRELLSVDAGDPRDRARFPARTLTRQETAPCMP